MALNMSNPSEVMSIYSSILNNENNWLLLHYINDAYDELALHSYGVEGLEGLKTKLSNLQQVFIGFYREEVEVDAGYIIINYIPSSVSAVKRARALVHSRRVGIIFKKHQAIYTVDSLSLITPHNVHQAITDAAFSSPTRHSPSLPAGVIDKPLPEPEHNSNIDPVPGYFHPAFQTAHSAIQEDSIGKNTTQSSSDHTRLPMVYATSHVTALLKGGRGSLFKLLGRKKKKDNFVRDMDPLLLPQTPPKDNGHFKIHPMRFDTRPSRTVRMLQHQRSRSMSDFAVISHVRNSEDMFIVQPEDHDLYLQDNTRIDQFPLRGKWAHKGTVPTDPVERARERRERQLQNEREEQELAREEVERQRRLKLEKEIFLRQEKEEAARRLADVQQEISRIRLERRRREQSEKAEEEQQRQELEYRKRRDRKRRSEEHQRLDKWRRQQLEDAARQSAEIQRGEEAKRRNKIQLAEAVVKKAKGERELTGWVTIQSRDEVSWRRRYFKFIGTTILLYRSAKDINSPLEEIDLRGSVSGLKEWYEGYEDLEAIAFSLVVEFKDGRKPLNMYADREEEKYKLLGLLRIAAGL